MKTLTKWPVVLLAIATVAACVWWYSCSRDSEKTAAADNTMIDPVLKKIDSIKADSTVHNIYRENAVNPEMISRIHGMQQYIDTLKEVLHITNNDLTGVQRTNAQLTVENQKMEKLLSENDSLKDNVIFFRDKYMTLLVNKDSNMFSLNYDVNLNTVTYRKRKHVFAPYENYVDVYSEDPRVKINGIQRFVVVPKPYRPKLNLKAEAGYSAILLPGMITNYLNGGLRLNINPGGRLTPTVGAGYWYNPSSGAYGRYINAGVGVKVVEF